MCVYFVRAFQCDNEVFQKAITIKTTASKCCLVTPIESGKQGKAFTTHLV